MFFKRIEVLDPENPAIYYYTNHSFTKPQSLNDKCTDGRPKNKYKIQGSRLLLIFGFLYSVFLIYLTIEKPQFAINYVQEMERHKNLSKQNIQLTGNITPLWLENKLLLSLNIVNNSSEQKKIKINDMTYQLDNNKERRSISKSFDDIILNQKENTSLPLEILLNKSQFLPKQVKIELSMNNKIYTLVLNV